MCETKDKGRPNRRRKVYFTCHPEDFNNCFEIIYRHIFKVLDCAIYYTQDMNSDYSDAIWNDDLAEMTLFLIPITKKLFQSDNRAMLLDIPFARENHIQILPFMMEDGLGDLFENSFGKVEYLSPLRKDTTEIAFEEKLKKCLGYLFFDDNLIKALPSVFRARIFLSYRKKDRVYANQLIKMIHEDPRFYDVAIWYDEYLTPGEAYNREIEEELIKDDIFMLLVTNNLFEDSNYVLATEYPKAKELGKKILPIEMEQTDVKTLQMLFEGVPESISVEEKEKIYEELNNYLEIIDPTSETDDDTTINFYIGMVYLLGIDVEKNNELAVKLITGEAEKDYLPAVELLCDMYSCGIGVDMDYQECIKWQEKDIELIKKDGDSDSDLLQKQKDLAFNYSVVGEYQKSLELALQIYDDFCEKYGEDNTDTIGFFQNIALLYGKTGSIDKELELEKEIYEKCNKNLGKTHEITLSSLENLISTYIKSGELLDAFLNAKKLCKLSKKALGEENYSTLSYRRMLGMIYITLGKYKKAKDELMDVYEIQKKHPDDDNCNGLNIAVTFNYLGKLYSGMGDYENAIKYAEEAFQIQKRWLGEEHPVTLDSLQIISGSYYGRKEYEKAISLEEKLYGINEKNYGEEYPQTITNISNLAVFYNEVGEHQKAMEYATKAYELNKKVLGEDHPETVKAKYNLSNSYYISGDIQKALENNLETYEFYKKNFGEMNPGTLQMKINLAILYYYMGEYEKSSKLAKSAYNPSRILLGKNSVFVENLNYLLDELKKQS